ncbi:hypothetical protein GCM10027046_37260 [Uliginosibacterium flavum]|uniref:YncE family protein n=1 Tax=Uliginosibacterium flavum TaxID=1396831 RepID=A0ABV2TN46_9RHOO
MFTRLSSIRLPIAAALALLALVTLAARHAPATPDTRPQAFDASRQLLFVAHAGDGAVRVLNLRNTIGEIGTLRAPARHQVHELKLDTNGRQLWVLGDDAVYCHDAVSLRMISRTPLPAGHAQRFARVGVNEFSLAAPVLSAASSVPHLE